MRIAILGFGKEGKSVLRFLKRTPRYKNAEIDILDKKQGKTYLGHLDAYDLIIKSPGVPFSLPEVAKAYANGTMFTSATALFFDHAKGLLIGVTGTKGKGTTSTLLYRILKQCKKDAYIAGNIGIPMLDVLPKLYNTSIAILELSSFQLHHLLFSPRIAVVLDIFPDHLDAHESFEEYLEAKGGIVAHQKEQDVVFYFSDNTYATDLAKQSHGKHIDIRPEAFTLFSVKDLQMRGMHNFRNAVMAASVALYLDCDPAIIKRVVQRFVGNPLRLQKVRDLDGILFYNDSASTNPISTAAAIQAFETPTILIAGGRDKGFPYDALKRVARWPALQHVVLVGENTSLLKKAFKGEEITEVHELEKAVRTAFRYVMKRRKKGELWNIVFSPGAASFDMFKNYKERGKKFNEIVKSLKI
ncbi:MAG: UDP-N-acetylmuramoylalanine--D-glutamate ligase [Candidatus Ryanbacteria bacterium RIFCSPHIGHO2_02_FULL_45_17b]|uniref:UDP-N-acetylmuramoylalanine--D-glutamate ligase n=1 Tax=Candidatus Ryanbacteria bacterium RIFCSPHIGHO2_01_FULL_45_22 TaxID=1802114 RepID=A0A1G2G214_9BACT|nr:MAG: UDP-N-acetylmuramoylalanine--D-glutamate ligase [Candidatus Ryanbacteria bacterium RIFCSPHIGHO2_01_FULL_45_22]OGZ47154.1 MAG: UDP-N-acetylmuramoylalanine--D-glutamate ligase [Candidatus Ryanbacteria bacterium RIFCSPHIGHO2_02_FULL_45_17b]